MRETPRHAFGLDLARAVAVCSVLVAHGSLFYASPDSPARYVLIVFGVAGVEIFFALSGFLVGRQLLLVAEGEASAWRFLQRRWWRTLPNYYLFLAINAALAWWVIDRTGLDARFLLFSQSLVQPARGNFFPESWSLAVEEWFYLLAALGFAAAALRRISVRTLGLLLLAVVISGPLVRYAAQELAALPIDGGVRKVSLLRLDALAYGLGVAWLERYRPAFFLHFAGYEARFAAMAMTFASVVVLAAWSRELAFFEPASGDGARGLAALLFSALPLAAALCLPGLAGWEVWHSPLAPVVRKLSEWSYALYLTHFPTLLVLLSLWPVPPGNGAMLAARTGAWLAIALVLAAAVYRWYEHPLTMRRPPLQAPRP